MGEICEFGTKQAIVAGVRVTGVDGIKRMDGFG